MPSTFLTLTNRLLRRVNEVTINQADFQSARGVQSMAKDAIVAAIEDINKIETEWPFNAQTLDVPLVVGQQDYTFPNDLRSVKWDSFLVLKDSTINLQTSSLTFVSRDYWDVHYRNADLDAGADGLNVPNMVLPSHGYGFTVSPSPDRVYTVRYEYFKLSPTLTLYDDKPSIPSVYDEVIIQGAIYHFYMFRSNAQQASMAEGRFKDEIKTMQNALLGRNDTMHSTLRVPRASPYTQGFRF